MRLFSKIWSLSIVNAAWQIVEFLFRPAPYTSYTASLLRPVPRNAYMIGISNLCFTYLSWPSFWLLQPSSSSSCRHFIIVWIVINICVLFCFALFSSLWVCVCVRLLYKYLAMRIIFYLLLFFFFSICIFGSLPVKLRYIFYYFPRLWAQFLAEQCYFLHVYFSIL